MPDGIDAEAHPDDNYASFLVAPLKVMLSQMQSAPPSDAGVIPKLLLIFDIIRGIPYAGESRLTAAVTIDNPYCSCKLTRVRSRCKGRATPTSRSRTRSTDSRMRCR